VTLYPALASWPNSTEALLLGLASLNPRYLLVVKTLFSMNDYFSINQKINGFAATYLFREGWFNEIPSINGNALPWLTYPAIHFLKDITHNRTKVLEFGAGYSSIFFNQCASECHTVEHNPEWFRKIKKDHPSFDILLCTEDTPNQPISPHYDEFIKLKFDLPLSNNLEHNKIHGLTNDFFQNYSSQIFNWPEGYFDTILIDGMARSLTGYYASRMISKSGVIVLDNSDRWQYNSLQNYLISQGFGRIDFWGPGPLNAYGWCTSLFSRSYDILNTKIDRPKGSGDLGW